MRRILEILALIIIISLLVPTNGWAKKNRPQDLEYLSEDGTWLLGYVKQISRSEVEEAIGLIDQAIVATMKERNFIPPAVALYRQIYEEPGDYHSFVLFLPPNRDLWWTKKSQVVFQLKDGSRRSSEKCLFTDDAKCQNQVYDSSKKSVITTRNLGPWGTKGGIILIAKFPRGSFNVNEATRLSVVNVT